MLKEIEADKAVAEEALPEIMMRIVTELHDVAYLIERIEPQLLELGGNSVLEHPDSLKVLQGIDLAVQKTRGLAEFIDTITGSIPSDWVVDMTTALSLVKLAEMQKALGAGLRHGHSQPLSKAAGDFDFF
ncbi:chemotaxis protein CheT [Rhizobium sp. CAU 1783]